MRLSLILCTMAWLKGLSKRLETLDTQAMAAVLMGSTMVQFLAFYTGMKFLISRNFHQSQHPIAPAAAQLTERSFALNTDQPKALLHQVIASALISSCATHRFPARLPILLCVGSCMASAYLAWSPIVRLFALSAEMRAGNKAVSDHFARVAFKQVGPGTILLAQSTMVAMAVAIGKSMPWRWAVPGTALYLITVAFL